MPLMPQFAQLRLDEGHERMVGEFFGRLDMRVDAAGAARVADEWRPDLIVRESWEYGSTIVAEERGIPLARVGLGRRGRGERLASAPRSRRRPRPRRGRAARRPRGERLRARPTSPTIPSRSRTPPCRLPPRTLRFRDAPRRRAGGRRRRAARLRQLRLGDGRRALPYYPGLYRAAIEALAPLPARVLVTVGEERDPASSPRCRRTCT